MLKNNSVRVAAAAMPRRFRRLAFATAVALSSVVAMAPSVRAQTDTFTVTPPADGTVYNWSNGSNWSAGAPSSSDTNVLSFSSQAHTYTANNDIAGTFALNSLLLDTTSGVNTFTISGNALSFQTNSSTSAAPTINLTGGGIVDIQAEVDFDSSYSSPLTINNAGTLILSGGSDSFPSGAIYLHGIRSDGSASTTYFRPTSTSSSTEYDPNTLFIGSTAGDNTSLVVDGSLAATQVYFAPYDVLLGGDYSSSGGKGSLEIGNNAFFAGPSVIYIYDGGTMKVDGTGVVNATAFQDGLGGVSTGAGELIVSDSSQFEVSNDSATALTYSGHIDGSGGHIILDSNTNEVLKGTNSYSGIVTLHDNAQITAGGTGTLFPNANVDLNGNNTKLNLAGYNNSVGGLSGSGTVSLSGATLTITNGVGDTFSGTIGPSADTGGVTKTGSGIETFTGTNTYTGTTNVSGGTLVITGNTSAGVMQVNSGGTLAGTGTVGVTKIGAAGVSTTGQIAPGLGSAHSYGTLTTTSLQIGTGTSFVFDLNLAGTTAGVDADEILVGGTGLSKFSGASGFNFAFTVEGSLPGGLGAETYTLVNNVSTDSTTGVRLSDLPSSVSLGTGLAGTFGSTNVGGVNYWNGMFTVTDTPEPGTFALFGFGLLPLGVAIRRRKSIKQG